FPRPLSSRKSLPHECRKFPDGAEAHALVEVDGLAVGGRHRKAHFPAAVLAQGHERAAQQFIARTRATDLRGHADLRDVARLRANAAGKRQAAEPAALQIDRDVRCWTKER